MSEFALVLGYSLLPVAGNLIGSAMAEGVRTPGWVRGASLHAAAGIAIALVAMDLVPRALGALETWALVVAFICGAVASVLIARGIKWLQGSRSDVGAWMVYAAVGADLVSDGLMTGAGSAVGSSLGFLLAASQSVANIPGGFAAAASLRENNIPRMQRIAVSVGMVVPVSVSAMLGLWLLGDADVFYQKSALMVIVGVLLLATVEDVIPEGDAPEPKRWISSTAFAAGFVIFALLSAGMR
ncbi:MAG: hypothetical protein APF80_13685 [Alphaproteobacteria bacterium BRH_c36]|nr:MAG: hypothetical protein APF80_13685 [Alphaproteobacteria bacterium BRH_c36]